MLDQYIAQAKGKRRAMQERLAKKKKKKLMSSEVEADPVDQIQVLYMAHS